MEFEFQEIEFHAKKIIISAIAPYSGSPIVAFLSPIVTFSCKFFISVIGPYSKCSIVTFLIPIVTFEDPIAAFSCKIF